MLLNPGVPQISLGEVAMITATPDYVRGSSASFSSKLDIFFLQAYGPRGIPPSVPGNVTLRFQVQLLKIN